MPANKRSTIVSKLGECKTLAEKFQFVMNGGNQDPLLALVFEAFAQSDFEQDPNPLPDFKDLIPQWRAALEAKTGKLILPLLMGRDATTIRKLAGFVETPKHPGPTDRLRAALFALRPGRYSWLE